MTPEGHEPRWDIDLAYGEDGEATVADLLGASAARVEVKRKRRRDFKFYVETAQSPLANDAYQPSGINTSEADYWAFVIADTGIIVCVPRERLRAVAVSAPQVEERDGDNPTKGRLVSGEDLFAETPVLRSVA